MASLMNQRASRLIDVCMVLDDLRMDVLYNHVAPEALELEAQEEVLLEAFELDVLQQQEGPEGLDDQDRVPPEHHTTHLPRGS